MRKDKLFILGILVLGCWVAGTFFLYFYRPKLVFNSADSLGYLRQKELLLRQIGEVRAKLDEQVRENRELLQELEQLRARANKSENKKKDEEFKDFDDSGARMLREDEKGGDKVHPDEVRREDQVAVLLFACNRPTVARALDSLLAARAREGPGAERRFPVIVSQDCGHAETRRVIQGYSPNVTLIEQPDLSEPKIPPKEMKFKGYFKIARHYGWALGQVFSQLNYQQAIVVEDDLEFSPDFFSYFRWTLPVLRTDPSLFCVSAWNDNGKEAVIDVKRPDLLYRTDFFGGLGWMLTKKLWDEELSAKWPRSYWDDWMREPEQRRGRACIRPEISRTKTFGKIGVSNGMFYEKHLKHIRLNDQYVDFAKKDLDFLRKDKYDGAMEEKLNRVPVVSLDEVKEGVAAKKHQEVRLLYHTKNGFKRLARALGVMDDFKSGVPRMAYRGVVATVYRGLRVYVAPNLNWKGYDPTW